MKSRYQIFIFFTLVFLPLFAQAQDKADKNETLIVFAASSLAPALEHISQTFHDEMGVEVSLAYASSAILARQIKAGAPADIFITADVAWLHWLGNEGVDLSSTAITSNQIILAALKQTGISRQTHINLTTIIDEISPQPMLIAMADPESVPLGQYSNESLRALDLYDQFKPFIIQANSAQATLRFLNSKAASLAIIYKSDLAQNPDLQQVFAFPTSSHAPIIYMASAVTLYKPNTAQAFINYLISPEVQQMFLNYGFESDPS